MKQAFLLRRMRHRHLPNSYTRSGIDQHGNNHSPTEQSYFPTAGRGAVPENGPFIGHHMARGGVPDGRANEYPSSNVCMEIQPYVPAPPIDPYPPSTITESRSLVAPVVPVGHIHCTNYNVSSMHDVEGGFSNHPLGNGGPLKRKRSDSFYSAGSSSSSQMPIEKPNMDCQSGPPYRGSLTIGGEDSSRNVRRRHRLELEPRTHVPDHSSQFYHPAHYSSAPVQHANLDSNGGQWNCVPPYAGSSHRRISPSDTSGARHEMNHFHIGGSSGDGRDSLFNRHHPVASSHSHHGPHAPSMREEHVSHSRRPEPSYGNGSRYSHYAHGGSSSTNGLHASPDNFSSRNSRHYSPGGWRSSYRSGRPRLAVDRFQPFYDTTESHDRMGETIVMVDRAPFYGNSRNFSDQYGDLRLDVDNMSYEELLNLGERIGNVSTGLSEDNMSKSVRVKVHYSSDQNQEEVSCPICLEEYQNGDKIGAMEKCGHDYHEDCIKKWLLMKKLCPICKTECSN